MKTFLEFVNETLNQMDRGQLSPRSALELAALTAARGEISGIFPVASVAAPTVSRVSFRKNVEVAPFKHEHVEVSVDLNGSTLEEGLALAKRSVDEALGINVTEAEVARAQEVLKRAKRAGIAPRRARLDVRDEDYEP
jgi:hypothetical protein